jgi:hypothetical protein
MTSCLRRVNKVRKICAKYMIETVSKDETNVSKYVVLNSKLHLQETVLS